MRDATMETLARWLVAGGKGFALVCLLIGLAACDHTSDRIDTKLKTEVRCWERQGICVTKKWKATGLIRGDKPELAEVIVSLKWSNTCDPDPEWFHAEDVDMEMYLKNKREIERGEGGSPELYLSSGEVQGSDVYRKRAELACSRVRTSLQAITLEDEHGLELYSHTTNDQLINLDPMENRDVQIKLSVPSVYLQQYKYLRISARFERSWMKGVKRH